MKKLYCICLFVVATMQSSNNQSLLKLYDEKLRPILNQAHGILPFSKALVLAHPKESGIAALTLTYLLHCKVKNFNEKKEQTFNKNLALVTKGASALGALGLGVNIFMNHYLPDNPISILTNEFLNKYPKELTIGAGAVLVTPILLTAAQILWNKIQKLNSSQKLLLAVLKREYKNSFLKYFENNQTALDLFLEQLLPLINNENYVVNIENNFTKEKKDEIRINLIQYLLDNDHFIINDVDKKIVLELINQKKSDIVFLYDEYESIDPITFNGHKIKNFYIKNEILNEIIKKIKFKENKDSLINNMFKIINNQSFFTNADINDLFKKTIALQLEKENKPLTIESIQSLFINNFLSDCINSLFLPFFNCTTNVVSFNKQNNVLNASMYINTYDRTLYNININLNNLF